MQPPPPRHPKKKTATCLPGVHNVCQLSVDSIRLYISTTRDVQTPGALRCIVEASEVSFTQIPHGYEQQPCLNAADQKKGPREHTETMARILLS